jgi:hypothetical protein
LLAPYVSWVRASPQHRVNFYLASNQATNLVTYAEGALSYLPSYLGGLTGVATQYFSDQRYPIIFNAPYNPANAPFNVHQTIQLKVDINGITGVVTLSWGSSQMHITPQCSDGVLYGFSDLSPTALYIVSLKQA